MHHFADNGPSDRRPSSEKQRDTHCFGLHHCDRLAVHNSSCHKGNVLLPQFESWLQDKPSSMGDVVFNDDMLQACNRISQDDDFRVFEDHPLSALLGRTFLPLACNAQFVEHGAKEARVVATTGRKEEQQSACAIIRSFNVLSDDIDRETSGVDQIKGLVMNTKGAVERNSHVRHRLGEAQPLEAGNEARKLLLSDHCKHERAQGQIDAALETTEVNRPQNVRQKAAGVTMTMETLGLIPHSEVTDEGGFHNDLETELKHRRCTELHCPLNCAEAKKRNKKKLFSVLKDQLKALEVERVKEAGGDKDTIKLAAKKGFEKQSNAAFKMPEWCECRLQLVNPVHCN